MEANFEVTSASVTDRGLSDKRPQNEDSYIELPFFGIFAVADGVGGAQAGDVASQMAVEMIGEAFTNKPENADAEEVLRVAIERANSAIYQMSHDLPQLSTMATTIVALHVAGNIATLGHVGDSRIYRIDSSGAISQETNDHSVVAEEVRAGRMTPEQAAVHPSRNVISRALGAESTVEVDLKTIMVEPDTSFLLCSDGITRHISDWEIESLFKAEKNLDTLCRVLKRICYDRGAEDNLTAVVVNIKGSSVAQDHNSSYAIVEEPEEETVATARSPFDEPAQPVIELPDNPVSTSPLSEENGDNILDLAPQEPVPAVVEPEPVSIEPEPVIEKEPELVQPLEPKPESDASSLGSEVAIPAVAAAGTLAAGAVAGSTGATISPSSFETTPRRYDAEESPKKTGFFGSFLSSFLMLVLGALAGGLGVWYVTQPTQPNEQSQTTPQSTPVLQTKAPPQFASFEQLRRDVDTDPNKYLETNKAFNPDADAADFYLKGRALLRINMPYEAKLAFIEAKKRLKPDSDDAATLETEIALALAVIGDPQASENLQKDLTAWDAAAKASANTSSPNSAANAAPETNTGAGAVAAPAARPAGARSVATKPVTAPSTPFNTNQPANSNR